MLRSSVELLVTLYRNVDASVSMLMVHRCGQKQIMSLGKHTMVPTTLTSSFRVSSARCRVHRPACRHSRARR
ncbi:hypothetical protein CN116_29400 [Sinorhizobium meliloti]|nr:hypothetical protein CN125_31880 [Sinorhizobium meliloti]RVM41608.1 hypothetical protein CN121_29280 [Sinorhizobium meliloti]RVM56930.1 hypothetical protein CN124_31095 [Sinorhizobium meliloti]RVM60967.1 hypothetical protein CN123_30165 [Sinorhizobium meliloti]RVM77285.1 hypothetical protein CN117_30190 [Sinorhizobium meliloti]